MAGERRQIIYIIAGSQLKGLGQTLKAIDRDNAGNDDLAGNLATVGGGVLVALGTGDVNSIRKGLELNIQLSQEWLDNNPNQDEQEASAIGT